MRTYTVGYATPRTFRRLDTRRLQAELSAIDRQALIFIGPSKGRTPVFLECHPTTDAARVSKCVSAVEAQAARLRLSLL